MFSLGNWALSKRGASLANEATSLCNCVLVFSLFAFVWWNLQPESISVVTAGPNHLEITRRGPGWPIPSFTGHARWDDGHVTGEKLIGHKFPSSFLQLLPNGFFGLLIVAALLANIARSYRDREAEADTNEEFDATDSSADETST